MLPSRRPQLDADNIHTQDAANRIEQFAIATADIENPADGPWMAAQGIQNHALISKETMQRAKLTVKPFPDLGRDARIVHDLRGERSLHAAITYLSGTAFFIT